MCSCSSVLFHLYDASMMCECFHILGHIEGSLSHISGVQVLMAMNFKNEIKWWGFNFLAVLLAWLLITVHKALLVTDSNPPIV